MKITKIKYTIRCVIIRKLKFENYKNCLGATQLEKKNNYLEKNKIDIHSLNKIIKNLIITINNKSKQQKTINQY